MISISKEQVSSLPVMEYDGRTIVINNPKDDYTKSLLDAVPSWEDELYA